MRFQIQKVNSFHSLPACLYFCSTIPLPRVTNLIFCAYFSWVMLLKCKQMCILYMCVYSFSVLYEQFHSVRIIVKLPLFSLTVYLENIYFKFPEQQSIRSRVCIFEIGYCQIALTEATPMNTSTNTWKCLFPHTFFCSVCYQIYGSSHN